jgi:hypothetical protein
MGYNTYNEIGVIYESTVVVRIKWDVMMLSNWWLDTNTTKKWINYLINPRWYSVYQKNYTRYVSRKWTDDVVFVNNMTIKFL